MSKSKSKNDIFLKLLEAKEGEISDTNATYIVSRTAFSEYNLNLI